MIAVIDVRLGNLAAVANMFDRIGARAEITADRAALERSSALVLPGVGAFDRGMSTIREQGLDEVVTARAAAGVPVLGICLGMQMLADGSDEGVLPGLGVIPGRVERIPEDAARRLPIPHMGWNQVEVPRPDELLVPGDQRFYFTHSYHVVCRDPADVVAWTTYGVPLAAAVRRGSVWGVQFHPEKSHRFGMALLTRFARLAGAA